MKREKHPPRTNPVETAHPGRAGKDRAGMPEELAQSSAAEFHEQKMIDLRMGHGLSGGSGLTVAAR